MHYVPVKQAEDHVHLREDWSSRERMLERAGLMGIERMPGDLGSGGEGADQKLTRLPSDRQSLQPGGLETAGGVRNQWGGVETAGEPDRGVSPGGARSGFEEQSAEGEVFRVEEAGRPSEHRGGGASPAGVEAWG